MLLILLLLIVREYLTVANIELFVETVHRKKLIFPKRSKNCQRYYFAVLQEIQTDVGLVVTFNNSTWYQVNSLLVKVVCFLGSLADLYNGCNILLFIASVRPSKWHPSRLSKMSLLHFHDLPKQSTKTSFKKKLSYIFTKKLLDHFL